MKAASGLRAGLVILLTWAALATTGCGDTARQAVKEGLYTYVSGRLSSDVSFAQMEAFVSSFLPGGTFWNGSPFI